MASPPVDEPAPSPALLACGYTDPGRERQENEDAFGLASDARLFIVADGMGGLADGAVAARLAVDELERFFRAQRAAPKSPWPHPIDKSASLGANLLRVGIKVANQKMRESAAEDAGRRRMGATLAALAIGESQLVAAHVGDVRIYRLREGKLSRLTRDHSILEEMLAAKPDLSPEEAANIVPRSVVTRALGSKDDVEPTVYANSFAIGDRYLICSDGLWGSVADPQIAAILTAYADIEQACQALIDTANAAGGPDNITGVLVQVGTGA